MLPADVRVTKQAEDTTYDERLKRTAWIRVEFMVGDHGPFIERFPKDGFTAAVRDLKLQEFANHIRT